MVLTKKYTKKLQPLNKFSHFVIIPKKFLFVLGIDPEQHKIEILLDDDSKIIIIKKEEEKKGV